MNERATSILDRLKKDIKQRSEQARKKNLEITRAQCLTALDACLQQTVKPHLPYPSFTQLK